MAIFSWVISTLERDLQPADMDGAVVRADWRCNAAQTEGTGDDEVTYSSSSYGTCGFTPDPTAPDFTPYDQLTEQQVLGWVWASGVDKDETEAALQANIESQKNPVTAHGVPWAQSA
jgi:hypothetical protein